MLGPPFGEVYKKKWLSLRQKKMKTKNTFNLSQKSKNGKERERKDLLFVSTQVHT